jgi:hypothetical protein
MSRFSCLVNTNDDDNKFSSFPNKDAYLSGIIDGILASAEDSNTNYNIKPTTTNYASVTTSATEYFTEHMTGSSMPTMQPTTMPSMEMPEQNMPSMEMPEQNMAYMEMPEQNMAYMEMPEQNIPLPTTTPIVIKPTSPHEMKIRSAPVKSDSYNYEISPSPSSYTFAIVILVTLIIFLLGFMYFPKKK